MKIGILTMFYNNYNYGGQLQAYALCKYLRNLGYESYLIKYKSSRNPIYTSIIEQSKQYSIFDVINKFFEKKVLKKLSFFIKDSINQRKKEFDKFINENDYYTENVYTDETLKDLNNEFDAFISGSDQVWNPNAVRYGYLQDFVDDSKIKISYAASLGREHISLKEIEVLKEYLTNFDYISVREKTGKRIIEQKLEKKVYEVLDPTFLLEKAHWENMIGSRMIKEKYVFCYFFSKSKKYRKKIYKYCKSNNYKIVYLPFPNLTFNLNDIFGKGKKISNIGPKEFLSLMYYSECVFTDSFHGIALSINLNKDFYAYSRNKKSNKVSMNSRIYDILSLFNLEERLFNGKINKIKKIDYDAVNTILDKKRVESYNFLIKSLNTTKNKNNIAYLSKKCTGCRNCLDICPQRAIELVDDVEGKKIRVDYNKCVNCGLCLKKCHLISNNTQIPIKVYAGYSKNIEIKNSTSGGIFYELAKEVINKRGLVIGAALINNQLKHIIIDDVEKIHFLQKSKYIESDYYLAKDEIEKIIDEKKVLFVGTPCQVASLKKKINHSNLTTIDILCHGTPTQNLFDKYIIDLEKKYKKKIINYEFRSKDRNIEGDIKITFEDNKIKYLNGFKDMYYVSFLKSNSLKKSCYYCKYQDKKRVSDISLGDYWGIEQQNEKFGGNNKISLITINSQVGEQLFKKITNSIEIIDGDYDLAIKNNSGLYFSHGFVPFKQKLIYKNINNNPCLYLERNLGVKKYIFNKLPLSLRKKIKSRRKK